MSPLLLSLFMNDLPDAIGGRNFVGNTVNTVYHADYLFLVAPTATCLQINDG